jgi:spore coat polysaccharide biosynthesis protein SpsF
MITNGKVNGHKFLPKVTVIIQSRMNSKRLPAKSMKDLAGKPLLAHVIERAKAIEGINSVVVATSTEESNTPIVDLAREMDVEIFVGSEKNVLERYYCAARQFGGDYIVRITGDNPFTDIDYASMAVEIAVESGADLTSITNIPLGTAVEVIKHEALKESYEMSSIDYHFEHVTPYIKEHPEFFTVQRHPIIFESPFHDLRLTVDTEQDYMLAKHLYANLYKGKPFSIQEVVEFLKEHPELVQINSTITQRPMTHAEHENIQ